MRLKNHQTLAMQRPEDDLKTRIRLVWALSYLVALFVGDKPRREVDALLHERGQVEPERVQDAEVVSELVDLVDVVPLVGREATHDEEANGDG